MEETESVHKSPRVVQLTDGNLVFLWGERSRRCSVDGQLWDMITNLPGIEPTNTLDAAAGQDGQLLQLRHGSNTPNTAIVLGLTTWSYGPTGAPDFVHSDGVWPHLWNWGRRGYVLASQPDQGRAAVIWPGNWPYEVWLLRVGEDGLTYGDALELGDGGADIAEDGWMDLAIDGVGRTRAVWRTADAAREIHTWTEAEQDQLLFADWGDHAHFPRLAGYPDGGFLLLLTPDVSSPDEDVLFMTLDR